MVVGGRAVEGGAVLGSVGRDARRERSAVPVHSHVAAVATNSERSVTPEKATASAEITGSVATTRSARYGTRSTA